MPDTATAEAPAAEETPREPCMCGCGGTPTRKRSRFLPGHDAQLKAELYRTIRDESKPVAEVEAARLRLDEFQWPQPAPKRSPKPKAKDGESDKGDSAT